MNSTQGGFLRQLAASGLKTCLSRLARVSPCTWQVPEISVSVGTLEEAVGRHDFRGGPAAAVYFTLNAGQALTALMLFDPADMECLAKGFTGHSFPRGQRTTMAEEVMLLELGNVVLNAMVNPVLNAARKCALPPVPEFAEGDAARLLQALGAAADLKRESLVVKAALVIKCENSGTTCEAFAMVPPGLYSAE